MSQSTVTEKRTVITSSSGGGSGFDSLEDIPYKSSLGSRSSNIMSRSSLPLRSSSGGTQVTRVVEYGYGSGVRSGMGPGGYSNVSNTGVSSVKSSREREKKDLQDLNERFASYIEKVRFLEAQNRKLGSELDELRSKWGKETTQIKQMYEAELAEARRLIDDLSKDKAALEIKMSSMQEQFGDMQRQLDEAKKYRQTDREQINKLNQQLSDCESEINMLRRTIESLETERARDKATINRLQQDVDKLRIDLNNETLAHLDAENRRQTLEEEMEFMKKVHEQELKELAALAYRDTTAENREFWKSELGQAIRDIQQEYDAKVEQLRGDMEGFYNLKIQEYRTGATKQNMEVTHIREENKKITKQVSDLRGKIADLEARNAQLEKQYQEALRELESRESDHMMEITQMKEEISKQRAEMEGILTELQTLMDAKLSLELEIAAYRKLLEGEENRVDWRSRTSLIMYRDAFKPRSIDRNEQEITKEKEVEKPIAAKVEKTVTRQPEQRDASPDTDAASSITMSDNELSAKGDEGELDLEDQSTGDKGLDVENIKVVDSEITGNGKGDGSSIDTVKSPIIEHVVKVKEEVQKIETQALNDETDSQLNGNINGEVVTNGESPIENKESDFIKQKDEVEIPLKIEPDISATKTPSPVQDVMSSVATTTVEASMTGRKSASPTEVDSQQDFVRGLDEKSSDTTATVEVTSPVNKEEISKQETIVDGEEKEISTKTTAPIDDENKIKEKISPTEKKSAGETESSNIVIDQQEEKQPDSVEHSEKTADVEKVDLIESQETKQHLLINKEESEMTVMVKESDLVNANVKSSNNIFDSGAIQSEDNISKSDIEQNNLEKSDTDKSSPKSSPGTTTGEIKLEPLTNNTESKVESLNGITEKEKENEIITQVMSPEIKSLDSRDSEGSEQTPGNISSEPTDTAVVDQKKMPESPSKTAEEVVSDDKNVTDYATTDKTEIDSTDALSDSNEKTDATKTPATNIEEVVIEKDVQHEKETATQEKITEKNEKITEKSDVSLATIAHSQTESKIETVIEKTSDTTPPDVSGQILETEISKKQETIEKSEDKILETVVQSKVIEKTQQDTARIEMSPTKELPDSLPDSKAESDVQMLTTESLATDTGSPDSKSPNIGKPDFPDKFPQSQSTENIEDDKTPEDENSKSSETSSKPSDPLTERNGTGVPSSKIEETPQSSGIADVQLVDSMSNNISNAQSNEVQKMDSETVNKICDENGDVSERIEKKSEETVKKNEQDIMTQSFISSNGLLINGDIKEEYVSDDKSTIASSEHTEKPKLNIDQHQTVVKDTSEEGSNKTEKADEEPQKDEGALQEKIENLLLNGQEETQQISTNKPDSQVSMKMMRGEVSAKTTYQRTSTGPIAICEVDPEAKFIMLENTSSGPNKKDVNLDGWCLKRMVDNKREYVYHFKNYTLKAGRKVKIMARGSSHEAGLNDLVYREEDNWGIGQQVTTCLVNDKNEEKASHIQKTNYN